MKKEKQNNITQLWQRYQLKVSLEGTKPPIWRRIVVDSRIPLDELHHVIQICMGWTNSHLHQYIDRQNNIYGEPDPEFGFGRINSENEYTLENLLKAEKDWIFYEYDFGDSWRHKVLLEKKLPPDNKAKTIECIKGMRQCPPEDCGGVWGYANLCEILANPDCDEYEDMLEWVGEDFDPTAPYDLLEAQEVLQEVFGDIRFSKRNQNKTELNQLLGNKPDLTDPDALFDSVLNNDEVPDELKSMLIEMLDGLSIIGELSEMLEESFDAFESIYNMTDNKKIKQIARKMMNKIDEE